MRIDLWLQFVKRDIQQRYRDTWLGFGWAFAAPILMLTVYTFVFREVFKARWGTGTGGGIEFALYLYAGLIVFNLFGDCLNRAPQLIVGQPSLVKKVVFPLELLGWVALSSALFHAVLNLGVLILVAALTLGVAPTAVLAPLVFVPLLPGILGLIWFFSSLGVYVRDIGMALGMVVSLLMFLCPVFYPASALPAEWQPLIMLNPLSVAIEQMRAVALQGKLPDPMAMLGVSAVSMLFYFLGRTWFRLTRRGFADVL